MADKENQAERFSPGWLRPGRLDMHLVMRSFLALLLILVPLACVTVGIDFASRANFLLSGASRPGNSSWMVVQLLLCKLPLMISTLLPLAMGAAAVMAVAPLISGGGLIALSAGGISPQRALRGIVLMAVLCGLVNIGLRLQVLPLLEARSQNLEDALGSRGEFSVAWEGSEQTRWFAGHVKLQPLTLQAVAVASSDGSMLIAREVELNPAGGALLSALEIDADGAVKAYPRYELHGSLAITESPDQLRRRLLPREGLLAYGLYLRGTYLDQSELWNRVLSGLGPLLATMMVLTSLARIENKGRLVLAGAQALLWSFVPLAALELGARVADSGVRIAGVLSPAWVVLGLMGLGLLLLHLPIWRRWRI